MRTLIPPVDCHSYVATVVEDEEMATCTLETRFVRRVVCARLTMRERRKH